MSLSKYLLMALVIAALVSPVLADAEVDNSTIYQSSSDSILSTPFVDFNLWILITLLGLGFLILSNITKPDQNPALWAIISPLFLFPSAYFSLMLRQSFVVSTLVDEGTGVGAIDEIHVHISNLMTHPEWLCVIMSIITILSFVNIWFIITKKPIEKTKKEEFVGGGGI